MILVLQSTLRRCSNVRYEQPVRPPRPDCFDGEERGCRGLGCFRPVAQVSAGLKTLRHYSGVRLPKD